MGEMWRFRLHTICYICCNKLQNHFFVKWGNCIHQYMLVSNLLPIIQTIPSVELSPHLIQCEITHRGIRDETIGLCTFYPKQVQEFDHRTLETRLYQPMMCADKLASGVQSGQKMAQPSELVIPPQDYCFFKWEHTTDTHGDGEASYVSYVKSRSIRVVAELPLCRFGRAQAEPK